MLVFFQHRVTDSSSPAVNGDVPQGSLPNEARRTNISHRILVSTLRCLFLSLVKGNPDLSADTKDKIVLQVLLDAHHPAVCKAICSSSFLDFFSDVQLMIWKVFKIPKMLAI